jgi:SsrA-binding protein
MSTNNSATRTREKRVVAENRQARHLYFIEETLEAGIMLMGWEVKAILAGQATFNGGSAYVLLENGEAFVDSLTITPLPQARKGLLTDISPNRKRKLLLNSTELTKLGRRVRERGYTIVPLALTYGSKLKLDIGLAKGKKLADQRDTVRARDLARETERQLRDM